MNHARRIQRMLIALAFGSVLFAARPAAFDNDGGCLYTTIDYTPPLGARYEMHYFKTQEGAFYYDYASSNTGPLVVLVAGVPESHYFDALRALLLDDGYRVLVLDLPGKEHTPLARRPTAEFVFAQFQELWSTFGFSLETDVSIVGTSISGPVTALMAARWRAQRPKLALVSALGMRRDWPLLVRVGSIPLLGDLLAPFLLPGQVADRWRKEELVCPQNFPGLFKRQQTEFRGGLARINHLELPKALALSDQTAVYQALGRTDVPVMLAYGDHDPFRDQIAKLQRVVPNANALDLKDSAHIIFVEQPAALFKILDAFSKWKPHPPAAEPGSDPPGSR